ncbi:hypothetical protein QJR26_02610 [Clostridium baratii]
MRAKINDRRVKDTSERNIFSYSESERETTLRYDYKNKVWEVETSVPSHITKLLKLKDNNFVVDTVTESGTITSIRGTLEQKQISFRNVKETSRELSEEEREVLRDRIKKAREKKRE